jgi:hypothetical protein
MLRVGSHADVGSAWLRGFGSSGCTRRSGAIRRPCGHINVKVFDLHCRVRAARLGCEKPALLVTARVNPGANVRFRALRLAARARVRLGRSATPHREERRLRGIARGLARRAARSAGGSEDQADRVAPSRFVNRHGHLERAGRRLLSHPQRGTRAVSVERAAPRPVDKTGRYSE